MGSAGREIQDSKTSQSLAGMVTTLRSSTSTSAASSALRRTKSLRLVRACSDAASKRARSSELTRTLSTDVVDDGLLMCMTMAYNPMSCKSLAKARASLYP